MDEALSISPIVALQNVYYISVSQVKCLGCGS